MKSAHYVILIALLTAFGCGRPGINGALAPAALRPSAADTLFRAEPAAIAPGEASELRWNIPGASSVLIEEAAGDVKLRVVGRFPGKGTLEVRPKEDTSYVISCEGNATFSCASVSIRVRAKRQ